MRAQDYFLSAQSSSSPKRNARTVSKANRRTPGKQNSKKNYRAGVPVHLFERLHGQATKAAATGQRDLLEISATPGYEDLLCTTIPEVWEDFQTSLAWVTSFAESDPRSWQHKRSQDLRRGKKHVDYVFDFHRLFKKAAYAV